MQARAPDEGPSGGRLFASDDGSRPYQSDSDVKGLHNPRLLRAVAKKYNIESTKSLVEAYNATTDKEERGILLRWLHTYGEGRNDYSLQPKYVIEYAELAKIVPRSTQDKKVLKSLVRALRSRLRLGEFLEKNTALALYRALVHVDSSAYDGAADLVDLVMKLLNSLSATPGLARENFKEHEASFLALLQVFFLLHENNRRNIDREDVEMLRRAMGEKEEALEQSRKYYPVKFHLEALRQAVERLKRPLTWLGFLGSLSVSHFHRFLVCDIDPTLIEDAYKRVRDEIYKWSVAKRSWFDSFRRMMAKRLEASKDEMKLKLFETSYNAAMKHQRNIKNREDLKALRFAIIHELGILARDGLSENARNAAATNLVDLTTQQAINEGWIDDVDILIALLDTIHEVYKAGQCNEKSKEALMALHQSCEGSNRDAFMEWLNGSSLEDKLRVESAQGVMLEHKKLLIKTGRDMGHTPSIRKDLKKSYLRDDFATATSLFEGVFRKHVKEMKHHVVVFEEIVEREEERGGEFSNRTRDRAKEYYDKKTRVAKPIGLDDLFKRRSLKPGDPESEVRSVLLYGNPGSGKTCIAKVFAHKWALGEMAQDLDAVYVVPVRVLNSAEYNRQKWTRLEEAISLRCFPQRNHPFYRENLITQIEDDLDDPSTLLVIDGLDEANDHARELVSTIWKRSCKVLLLSRPYNMRDLESRVDVQVECLGFNDEQLRDYIRSELSEDEAPRLIRFLENSSVMWEMAHVPVTAHILCSLSKEHGGAIEEEGKSANTFQLYNDMTNYVWKRFEEKQAARNVVRKMELFLDLEKIAFEALRKGLILIHERFVMENATSNHAARTFKESGLLLVVLEGQEYQFPHLTFQEYFAGRFIARSLKNKGSDDEKRVRKFIQEGKYNRKNDVTMHFAMHAFARGRGDALRTMLSTFGDQPVEVLGIQHFFLKTRILEAILQETDEDDLEDVLNDEQAIELAEGARHLLERTIDDVLIREIVIEEFQHLPCVLKGFPQVLNDTVNEVKKKVACSHHLTWVEMAKIADILRLTKYTPEQNDHICQFIMQLVEESEDRWTQKERIERLTFLAELLPQHSSDILSPLAKEYRDEDSDVRQAAIEAIGRAIAAAPQHANEVLPTLSKGCRDEDSHVRQAAIEAIGSVVAAATQCTGEVLSTLAKGCGDNDADVRRAAMDAINAIVNKSSHTLSELLPLLEIGSADEDFVVRQNAIEVAGKAFVSEQYLPPWSLPMLEKRCIDKNFFVRQSAIEAVGQVVKTAPNLAGELLNLLDGGCTDNVYFVRCTAIQIVGKVVGATPNLTDRFLPMLERSHRDEDFFVRSNALKAVGSAVGAAPQLAGELMPMLERGCMDELSDVRSNALKAVGSVVDAAPQLAGELVPMLERGCADEHSDVRSNALKAVRAVVNLVGKLVRSNESKTIGGVVASALHLVGEVSPMLEKRCDKEHFSVHQNPETTPNESRLDWMTSPSSISALKYNLLLIFIQNSFTLDPSKEDKKVPIVLHALSSHEIGRWDRKIFDKHLVRLKEYFEEKFPGLLENLVMKE